MTETTDLRAWDFALHVFGRAIDGDLEPLARHIEQGGDLDPVVRKWLAAHLRGETARTPGLKRTTGQQVREAKVLAALFFLQEIEEEARGKRGARARAIRALLDCSPSLTERTVKRYLANYSEAIGQDRE